MPVKKYDFIIGIDPGVNTGFGLYDCHNRKLKMVTSLIIHQVMAIVKTETANGNKCLVRVEDARQRKWFGNSGREKLQGAGSAKRDAKIWDDFLKDLKVDYQMVPPKANKTKLDQTRFKMITGWGSATNEHGRDAAMLCFGY